jgi:hypothetical protein
MPGKQAYLYYEFLSENLRGFYQNGFVCEQAAIESIPAIFGSSQSWSAEITLCACAEAAPIRIRSNMFHEF